MMPFCKLFMERPS